MEEIKNKYYLAGTTFLILVLGSIIVYHMTVSFKGQNPIIWIVLYFGLFIGAIIVRRKKWKKK